MASECWCFLGKHTTTQDRLTSCFFDGWRSACLVCLEDRAEAYRNWRGTPKRKVDSDSDSESHPNPEPKKVSAAPLAPASSSSSSAPIPNPFEAIRKELAELKQRQGDHQARMDYMNTRINTSALRAHAIADRVKKCENRLDEHKL